MARGRRVIYVGWVTKRDGWLEKHGLVEWDTWLERDGRVSERDRKHYECIHYETHIHRYYYNHLHFIPAQSLLITGFCRSLVHTIAHTGFNSLTCIRRQKNLEKMMKNEDLQ